MKNRLYIIGFILITLTSCKDDDISVFDKSADQRAAEAIAKLKADLTAPPNGWKVKYKPESESGSFYVLMDFNDDNKVIIKTDLGANNGEFHQQTVSYRIDNSLGLELILENYSFFSYLFEQDEASFGAEYEFNYVNKTPDNALVFNSKTDPADPTILLFQPATAADVNLLGITVSDNLNTMADDLDKFTSSLKIQYENKDLILYLSMDDLRRTVNITGASKKTNTQVTQSLDFTTGFLIKGDSVVFDSPLTGFILGTSVNLKAIKFNTLSNASLSVCASPIPIHSYSGVTSSNDQVRLETSLVDVGGASFATLSDFYFSPLVYIFKEGISQDSAIRADVAGALEMHMYYGLELNDGSKLYGIGFVIENIDGSITFALKEFTPVLNNNNIVFNFATGYRLFGNQQTDADLNKIDTYLNGLAEGDKTYVFKIGEDLYEFYNPCSRWSFVFINANR